MKLYHENRRGTGTAVNIYMSLGALVFDVARQDPNVERYLPAGGRFVSSFDWGDSQAFRLNGIEAAQILEVLRGCAESVCDGKGIVQRTGPRSVNIRFEHVIEPVPGYRFTGIVKASPKEEGDVREFFFTTSEGFALSVALEGTIKEMFFYD